MGCFWGDVGFDFGVQGIYAEGLARVSVEVPERMAVGHVVEVSGNVKQSRELAVNVAEGLRVREVFVIPVTGWRLGVSCSRWIWIFWRRG